MADERDLLSQLRALGDPDEGEEQAGALYEHDVGVSETARRLESEGFFDEVQAEQERSRRIAEAKAFINSRKQQLRREHEEAFGPQTPAVPEEEDSFGGEVFREIGRGFAGTIPKMAGGFLRQSATAIGDPEGDPIDPRVALARGMTETGKSLSALGERNIRSIPARRVQDMTKIRTDSIKSFAKDASDWAASQVGQAIGTGAPMIGAGLVLGLPGLAVTAFPMGIGEVRETLEEEGLSDPELVNRYTWMAGIAVGALDAIVPAHILSDEFKRGAGKYVLTRMAKTAAQIGAEEALTEAMQEVVQIAAAAEARGLHAGEDRVSENVYNIGRELFEKRWQIAEGGAGGFIGGTTLGSARIVQSGFEQPEQKPAEAANCISASWIAAGSSIVAARRSR